MEMAGPARKLLLVAPPLGSRGGVADFCSLLLKNLNPDFNVDVLQVGDFQGDHLFLRVYALLRNAQRLRSKLKKSKYDIVHINPSFKPGALLRDSLYLTAIHRHGYRHKTIVFFHGWDLHLAERMIHNPLLRQIFAKVYETVGVMFIHFLKSQEQLIQLGVDPQKIRKITLMYESMGGKDLMRNRGDGVNILFMSRLLKDKGVYIAADVSRLLRTSGLHAFKLVIAGDGEEYESLKRYIDTHDMADYLEAPGFVTEDEKTRLLEKSDVFLFPTFYGEGCPRVILEAMGAGLAVVSTPVAAIPDIIEHGKNGFLINSRDPHEFCAIIRRLIEDRPLLKRIQQVNREKAEKNYEVKKVMSYLESVYRSL